MLGQEGGSTADTSPSRSPRPSPSRTAYTRALFDPRKSPIYLYGPYKREGFETAPSNQAFDQSLRDRDQNWGLRDLEALAATAQTLGFSGPVITEMPANNLSAVFRRM
jgi:hypothetical protein